MKALFKIETSTSEKKVAAKDFISREWDRRVA